MVICPFWPRITRAIHSLLRSNSCAIHIASTGTLSVASNWKQILESLGNSCLIVHEAYSR